MDFYSQWIKDLAKDIFLDQRGRGVRIIDLPGNFEFAIDISHGDEEARIKQALTKAGVVFASKFEHTIVVYSYPPDVKLEL